jgi:hypothetical protein
VWLIMTRSGAPTRASLSRRFSSSHLSCGTGRPNFRACSLSGADSTGHGAGLAAAGAAFDVRWRPVDPDSPLAPSITVRIVGVSFVAAGLIPVRAARLRRRSAIGTARRSR